jgi:hypothetical protein
VGGYTKLFGSIVHSTIWRAPDHVRLVWITMLALSDRHGVVEASVPGLADAARVTIQQCELALVELMAPDPYSRTKDNEGRRIAEVDGGWLVLNRTKYRDSESNENDRAKNLARVKRHRERKAVMALQTITERDSATVTVCNALSPQSEAESEAETERSDPDGEGPPKVKTITRAAPRRPETPLPTDLQPSAQDRAYCRTANLDLALEWDKFKAHALTSDRRARNWQAAFRGWLVKANQFQQEHNAAAPARLKAWSEEKAAGLPPISAVLPGMRVVQSMPRKESANEAEQRLRAEGQRQLAALAAAEGGRNG